MAADAAVAAGKPPQTAAGLEQAWKREARPARPGYHGHIFRIPWNRAGVLGLLRSHRQQSGQEWRRQVRD